MSQPHAYLFAVYDADGRFIQAYASAKWAMARADKHAGSRVATYVHEGNKLGVEMAHFMNGRTNN